MTDDSIFVGLGSSQQLVKIIKQRESKRLFVVRGSKSFVGGPIADLLEGLKNEIDIVEFYGFDHNPSAVDVNKALALIGQDLPDLIVGVGGGSAIDMAKSIRAALALGYEETVLRARENIKVTSNDSTCPLVAIPTTAGTGSEVTSFAVIYIDGVKYSVAGEGVLPDYAIIDPELTYDLPKKVTADTGLDALCQGIESFWSVKSTPQSRVFAVQAVEAVMQNLESAVNSPAPESRYAMCLASHNAGKAINLTTTTAAHAISYPLTMHFGIAHGHAVALTLSEFLIFNHPTHPTFSERLSDSLDSAEYTQRMEQLMEAIGVTSADQASDKIYRLLSSIGLEVSLAAFGVDAESFDLILSEVNPLRLSNNPTSISSDMLTKALSQPFLNSTLSKLSQND